MITEFTLEYAWCHTKVIRFWFQYSNWSLKHKILPVVEPCNCLVDVNEIVEILAVVEESTAVVIGSTNFM